MPPKLDPTLEGNSKNNHEVTPLIEQLSQSQKQQENYLARYGVSREVVKNWLSTSQSILDITNQPSLIESADVAIAQVVDTYSKHPDRLSHTIVCRGDIAEDCMKAFKVHPILQHCRISGRPANIGAPFSLTVSWDGKSFDQTWVSANIAPQIPSRTKSQFVVADIRSKIGKVDGFPMNDESYRGNNVVAFPGKDDFPLLTDKVIDSHIEGSSDNELDQLAKIADDLLATQPILQEDLPSQKKGILSSVSTWFGNVKQKAKSFFSKFKS